MRTPRPSRRASPIPARRYHRWSHAAAAARAPTAGAACALFAHVGRSPAGAKTEPFGAGPRVLHILVSFDTEIKIVQYGAVETKAIDGRNKLLRLMRYESYTDQGTNFIFYSKITNFNHFEV